MNKKLCIIAAICIFTAGQTFAQNEDNTDNKYLQKLIKQEKTDNLSPEYLQSVEQIFYKQMFAKKYDAALKTADYQINANKYYYGETSPQAGFAYIAKSRYYNSIIMPEKARINIDKAQEIAQNNDNTELKCHVYYGYANYYSSIEQNYDVLKYLPQFYTNDNADKYIELAQIYANIRDFKNALNYYNKYYQEILKDKNNLNINKINYYLNLASLYKDNSQYNKTYENIKKAEDIISQIPDIDSNTLFNFYINKSQYFHEIENHDAEKEELDKAYEIALKNGDINLIDNSMNYYFDYYKEIKDYKTAKKYLKSEQNLSKKAPAHSLLFLRLAEKEIDLYKDSGSLKKAEKLAALCVEEITPVKEYAPVLYGKFLRKSAKIKIAVGKIQEAELLLDEAKKAYESVLPDNAFEFYELYKNYGNLYRSENKTDEAINAFNKALKINSALQGENHKDIADLYRDISNTIADTDNTKAEEYNKKAEEIYKKCYGK